MTAHCDEHLSVLPTHYVLALRAQARRKEKDKKMNSHITVTEIRESTTASDIEALTQCGYSADEIISLLWLRQHYQSGGSDRASVVRYLEFLRHLVMSGKLDA
jgi:hypothetical protein